MTYGQPDIPQHSDYESKEFYLKESLKLSELKIKYQDDVFIAIERKVVLLITLYIFTIAYMFSWDDVTIYVLNENYNVTDIITVLMSILTIAAIVGSLVLYPRRFEGAGANPKYFMNNYNFNFNEMATNLLNEQYEERLKINKKTLNTKIFFLRASLALGIVCIITTGLLQIVIKLYYKNPATIDTLISDCQVFLK